MNGVFTQSGEREGSKKDFSLWSKQGFLAEPALSTVEGSDVWMRFMKPCRFLARPHSTQTLDPVL